MVLRLFRKEKKEETIDTQIKKIPIEPILKHTKDKQIKTKYIDSNYIKTGLQEALIACGITYDQNNKEIIYKIRIRSSFEEDNYKTKNQQPKKHLELPISPDIVFALVLSYKRISDYDEIFLEFFRENIGAALKYGVVVKTYEESKTNEKRKLENLTEKIKTYGDVKTPENTGLSRKFLALAEVANTAARKTYYFAPKYF